MGSILIAECSCGFKSNKIFAGGGMLNFETVCNVPVACMTCGILFERNIMSKEYVRCPKCRRKATIYNDAFSPHEEKSKSPIFSWRLNDDKVICLTDDFHYCPECKQNKMRFFEVGCWD